MGVKKQSSRKKRSAAVATTLAAAMLLTGTYAWQNISQEVLNEAGGIINPGGRLHDDFDGKNKDIYVENFTSPEDGTPIFARVRLDEYMETGKDAGINFDKTDREVEVIGNTNANVNDKSTWVIHKMDCDDESEKQHKLIHEYWRWKTGGSTKYMPTFNKNKDSLTADINGTYEGPDLDREKSEDKYKDYIDYSKGDNSTKTADAFYDADDNDIDEGESGIEGTNFTKTEETHTTLDTSNATVITMEEWKDQGSKIGPYWVYDTDGWVYWAEPILPGESTGLLLDEIEIIQEPDEKWYYSINVTGQFASAGDWSGFSDENGGQASEDALKLLNQAADLLPKIEEMKIKGSSTQYAYAGSPLDLNSFVRMNVSHETKDKKESYILWSCEPETTALSSSTFEPTSKMVGDIYRFTGVSAYNSEKKVELYVYVLPAEATGVVKGEQDGKVYASFGDNTFKEIKKNADDDSKFILSNFISAGKDKIIGNGDDKNNVVVLDDPDPNFGSKFIGPDGDGNYMAVGADKLLGTEDDIKVTGFPDHLTSTLANGIKITTKDNTTTVKVGKNLKLNAQVTMRGKPISNQDVIWTLSGNTSANTKIDKSTGLLSVDINETHENVLTVSVKSKLAPTVITTTKITVKPLDFDDIVDIDAGSTTTVTIDGRQWYVIAKDAGTGQALLFSTKSFKTMEWDPYVAWNSSKNAIRNYLIKWLDGTSVLKYKAVETTIQTRNANKNYSGWNTAQDKIFLLSTADCVDKFGKSAEAHSEDYTFNSTPVAKNFLGNGKFWTRNITNTNTSKNKLVFAINKGAVVTLDTVVHYASVDSAGVRPALWVDISESSD